MIEDVSSDLLNVYFLSGTTNSCHLENNSVGKLLLIVVGLFFKHLYLTNVEIGIYRIDPGHWELVFERVILTCKPILFNALLYCLCRKKWRVTKTEQAKDF